MKLIHGDCLEEMPKLAAGSVDAVIIDPPYYKIDGSEWDNQWKTIDEYINFIEDAVLKSKRVLKDNGSLFIFGDDKNIAYIQVCIDQHLTLLNNIVWHKTNNQSIKAAPNLRSFAPMTERILFYTPQLCKTGLETVKLDLNNFVPLREYFRDYQSALGLSLKKINETLGHRRAEHAFYWNSTQWDLPTSETYAELGRLEHGEFVRREYEDLRREYEDLRREYEDLRRTFNASERTLDVITGPIISASENSKHPTTKPVYIMEKLILASTNPGDTVLDFCFGSGATGVACVRTGRNFIGIEKDPDYFKIAEKRIAAAQPALFS